ncbi:glycosyltransferase family 4 protein [Candidatus Roizmanbacteria bacterium]|nr:glycosyltransferase family 4 protein [Candidatus Roizmanbacteria bacterium]
MLQDLGKRKTVGILTTFYEFSNSYSLCSVVESQLQALIKYGYKTVLFVHDNFKDDDKVPEGVEIRKIVPRFLLVDYSAHQEVSPDLDNQAEEAYQALKKHCEDIDIILNHDLIFQAWFLPYCMAIHKYAEESDIKWFHWIHSNPSTAPRGLKFPHILRYKLPKNSKLVYLNNYYLVRVAEAYNAFPKDVRIVYNPLDPRIFLKLDPLVESLINKYDILSADFLQVYPVSTPRMNSGKQLHIIIDIMSKLKKMGKKVAVVVCNAHANDKREKQLIGETINQASLLGITRNELIFTSLEDEPKYEHGVDRNIVSQLFQLSNLFIFPSLSENCSLILLEAMLSKCLLVLNDNVPPMREFAKENALYFKFGSNEDIITYQDRDKWMEDIAKIIIAEMNTNRALKASSDIKKHYSFDYIFKNSIEPLFSEI